MVKFKASRILLLILILGTVLFVTSCSTTDARVIECSNLFFDCDSSDCSDQCGKKATERGQVLVSSEEINDGSGCWCEYEDAELRLDG